LVETLISKGLNVGENISQLTPPLYLRLIREERNLVRFLPWLFQEKIESSASEGQAKLGEGRWSEAQDLRSWGQGPHLETQ
jgi:hypothetical protein